MPGPVTHILVDDHHRLDALLHRAFAVPTEVDLAAYDAFRKGLLRHIGLEEKILFPAAQRAQGGVPLEVAARLRLDHGALAALLVPPPTAPIGAALRAILLAHNPLEEGERGVYAACEALLGDQSRALAEDLRAAPEVRVNPNVDTDLAREAMRRALARAGYEFERIADVGENRRA
jgi:hemerythrin HHE cation binding domain-containing protein